MNKLCNRFAESIQMPASPNLVYSLQLQASITCSQALCARLNLKDWVNPSTIVIHFTKNYTSLGVSENPGKNTYGSDAFILSMYRKTIISTR